ncbi:MAG TPA: GYD domain-containing protein [Candidatus Acidoferrum sp.]|nr:GYD domain-containing protein [Candidatus Acidoferrum sp.]
MPNYLHQVSYTPEAWARLISNPQDRIEAVRAPIEKLGGRINTAFFAFGEYDLVIITEMPDNVSAAAIAIAFAAGGAVKNAKTTPLMTAGEAVEALKKAGTTGYRSVTAGTSAAAARP